MCQNFCLSIVLVIVANVCEFFQQLKAENSIKWSASSLIYRRFPEIAISVRLQCSPVCTNNTEITNNLSFLKARLWELLELLLRFNIQSSFLLLSVSLIGQLFTPEPCIEMVFNVKFAAAEIIIALCSFVVVWRDQRITEQRSDKCRLCQTRWIHSVVAGV